MRLKKLLSGMGVKLNSRLSVINITSIVADSRDAKNDSLFIAIEGSRFDGHRFVKEAFEKGSRAVIVDKAKNMPCATGEIIDVRDTRKALSVASKNFYESPSERLKTIGITGTNGKTTTAFLIESIFNRGRIPCGVIGTIQYKTGNRIIHAERTTPDAVTINALLDEMLKNKLKAAVLEISSHALDQKRADDIFFDAAIFTNLTHEHLDYHKDLERYFRSKVKIFANLKKKGKAIINADDASKSRIIKIVRHKKITYGLNGQADVKAKIKKLGLDGSSFIVEINKKDAFTIDTKLIGMHNVSNILAAVAAGVSQDIGSRAIKEGIEKVEYVKGRLEPVDIKSEFRVFVDYAHTHNALENVLKFLNQIKKGRIITVFGCGGDRDRLKRPLMGHVAQSLSDFVIITNDNPRSEKPERIAGDIEMGMDKKQGAYAVILDRKKAIENAIKKAKKGDIVLIAGKGHEKTQVSGDVEIPFDDKEIAKNAYNRRSYK